MNRREIIDEMILQIKEKSLSIQQCLLELEGQMKKSENTEDLMVKIKQWRTMLDTPEFKDTDAGLVFEEMEHCIKRAVSTGKYLKSNNNKGGIENGKNKN